MATAPPESLAPTSAVSLVTQTRVAPGHEAEFARWQQQLSDVVTQAPGFLEQTIIPPSPPAQVDWAIVQRFASAEAARAWLQSDQRLQLLSTIQPLLVGQDDVHLFEDGTGPRLAAPVTAVTVIGPLASTDTRGSAAPEASEMVPASVPRSAPS